MKISFVFIYIAIAATAEMWQTNNSSRIAFSIMKKGSLCKNDAGNKFSFSCNSPKKILVLVQSFPLSTQSGSDKRAFHVIELLLALGHTVQFAALFRSPGSPSNDDKTLVEALDVTIFRTTLLTKSNYEELYGYTHPPIDVSALLIIV